ncbi:MAG: zf-TFIIB domain-containing protein [Acidimicrobiales bacterium]
MNCPLCHDRALVPHHRAGIEIDVCPHCGGVWLDRNELDRLLAAESRPAPSPSPVAQRPARDDRYDRYDRRDDGNRRSGGSGKRRKKKKSWADKLGDALEDVLDL